MENKKDFLLEIYQDLSQWFDQVKAEHKPQMIAFVKQASLYALAAEKMSEEKVNQFSQNLRYDLHDFYQLNQAQVKHSTYLGLLNEVFWSNLAQLTDKSQVEWAELVEDFKHDGVYKTGDIIGFGELVCQQCDEKKHIMHVSQVSECIQCGGKVFTRISLAP